MEIGKQEAAEDPFRRLEIQGPMGGSPPQTCSRPHHTVPVSAIIRFAFSHAMGTSADPAPVLAALLAGKTRFAGVLLGGGILLVRDEYPALQSREAFPCHDSVLIAIPSKGLS
jgi:hypothetical protein